MTKRLIKRSLALVLIVLVLISATVFADSLRTEIFYSVDPSDTEYFNTQDERYGVHSVEISNILNVEGRKITVLNATDIKVIKEAINSELAVYKLTTEESEQYNKYLSEGLWEYYNNPDTKVAYSVDNNIVIENSLRISGTSLVSQEGTTVSLNEEGVYYLYFGNGENQMQEIMKLIEVVKENKDNSPKSDDLELKATPTSSKVLVDGKEISFDAYNIKDNNYLKLRDLASAISGTEKEFEVTWDGDMKVIRLTSEKPYTVVGGEMTYGDGKSKTPILNTSIIYKDDVKLELTAYNIAGNNYFKLRDIGEAFDFGVNWDGAAKIIKIDTNLAYIKD